MIDYSPLFKTMEIKKVSMKELEEKLHQFSFREKVESGEYLNLSTVDKICAILNCQITDVIKLFYKKNVNTDICCGRYCKEVKRSFRVA